MKYTFIKVLCVLLAVVTMSSCHISRKKPADKVVVISKSKSASRKDNGLHKGWYKNPNNPHHPRTTNPGHTKQKGKAKSNTTVVVVKTQNVTSSNGKQSAKGSSGGKGGHHSKGKKGKN